MENDDNVMEFLLSSSVKVTRLISNYEPFYLFDNGTTSRWNSLLILVCIRKSYIVYLESYVVPRSWIFIFLVMEKSWKINVGKEGAPCAANLI